GGNSLAALTNAETNQAKDIAQEARQPQVQRDIAGFTAAGAAAKTPADLLNNPNALNVLLTANRLSDHVAHPALARNALLSNIQDSKSLANTLTDTRWKQVAQTYNFANGGLTALSNPKTIATITNGYAEVVWRQSLDATTPGLSNALTFRAEAGTITSVDQILGDPVLRTVVTTALGIPEQIAFQDLPAQERAITTQLDISRLKDQRFVESFTQRYLIAAAAASSAATPSSDLSALAVQA